MAEQLALVRTCDFATANISSVSLLSSTGIEIAEDGWQPQVIPQGASEIEEALTFVVNGTSDNALATTLQAVYQKRKEIEWSKSPAERYQVFLIDQLSGETNPRQAIVKSLDFVPGASLHDYYPVRNSHSWKGAQLGLVRGHWENTTATTVSASSISVSGGTAVGTTVVGDVSARLARIEFDSSATITEMWWGFKTARNITLANFKSPWDITAGGTFVSFGDTSVGTATITTTFSSTAAMNWRYTFTPANVTATNLEDLRGTYRLLIPMQVDSGVTARVKMSNGLTGAVVYNEPVSATSTAWQLYDTGIFTFPCGGAGNPSYSAMENSSVIIYAERTAGTGSLRYSFNHIAIPVDEGCGHWENGQGYKSQILCDALGRITSQDYNAATAITGALDTSGTNADDCVVPLGLYDIVVAGQRAGSFVSTDTINVTMQYFPRWCVLRGSS